jgi:hypothetical protein
MSPLTHLNVPEFDGPVVACCQKLRVVWRPSAARYLIAVTLERMHWLKSLCVLDNKQNRELMTEMSQMIAPQSEIADISHTPYLQIPDDDFAVSRGRGQVLSVV